MKIGDVLSAWVGAAQTLVMLRVIDRAMHVEPRDPRRDRIWRGSGYDVMRRGDGLRALKWVLDGGPAELLAAALESANSSD
jgi:hypothetical protein